MKPVAIFRHATHIGPVYFAEYLLNLCFYIYINIA